MAIKLLPNKLRHSIARALYRDFFYQGGHPGKLLMEQLRLLSDEERRFFGACFTQMQQSRSQLFQDLWVVQQTGGKKGGFFVEFGATNGIDLSNSYLLEKEYGWNGILAEPNPLWRDALRQNRTANISVKCVYSRSGEKVQFLDAPMPELAGITSFIKKSKQKKWLKKSSLFEVETVSLNDLLVEYSAPNQIDFISVDTEGSEFEILNCFDFDRWDVRLWCIEHNNGPTEKLLDALFASKGYIRSMANVSLFDAWYVKA